MDGKVVVVGQLWLDSRAGAEWSEVFNSLEEALGTVNIRSTHGLGRVLPNSVRIYRLGEEIPVVSKEVREQKIVETTRTVVALKE